MCPYDGVAFFEVPGYVSGYGCPLCGSVRSDRMHLPVPVDKAQEFLETAKNKN